jgi:hypothetical protein
LPAWEKTVFIDIIRSQRDHAYKHYKKYTLIQQHWLNYRELYRLYREAGSKEERREIKKIIVKEGLKKLS